MKNSGGKLEFISSKIDLIEEDKIIGQFGEPWNWTKLTKKMKVAHVGAIHHHSIFKKYGSFNPTYKIAGDYEFLLQTRNRLRTGFMNKVTVQMRTGGASVSSNKVFHEVMRAKIESGVRNKNLAKVDMFVALIKQRVKNLFHLV